MSLHSKTGERILILLFSSFEYIFSSRLKPYRYACKYLLWIFLFIEPRKIFLENHCNIYSNKNSTCLWKIYTFLGIILKCDAYYLKCDRHIGLYKLQKTLEAVINTSFILHISYVCIQNFYSIIIINKS